MVSMAGSATFLYTISSQIHFPAMPILVEDYRMATAFVNFTVTSYMVLQGLAPVYMGTFADDNGRRPAYIVAFFVYTAANIGLSLQKNYAALITFRCIQSAGSSGALLLGYEVAADIAFPDKRGQFMAPMTASSAVAPALGPVIGG